jgi:apolipoprotein N-acyltransferase
VRSIYSRIGSGFGLVELGLGFTQPQAIRLTRLGEKQKSMRVRSEVATIFYGLAVGLGFFWIMGFAIGYPNPFVPVIPFALAVLSLWVGWKLEQ